MGDYGPDEWKRISQILCENERRDLEKKVEEEFHEIWMPKLEYLNEDIYQMIARSMMDKYPICPIYLEKREARKKEEKRWNSLTPQQQEVETYIIYSRMNC
jgi:hypothetical protein